MIEHISEKESISRLFFYLSKLYDREKYRDFRAVYQFVLKGEIDTYCFHLLVPGGGKDIKRAEGRHPRPSMTFTASLPVWFDVIIKKYSAIWWLITGRFSVKGSPYFLWMFARIFDRELSEKDLPGAEDLPWDHEIKRKRRWTAPDKVLVINSSPRKEDGYTFFYLRRFIEGMRSAGASVELINLYDKDIEIEPCRGCFECWADQDSDCVISDSARELIKKYEKARLIVYAFPLYFGSMPGKLKNFIDRIFITAAPANVLFADATRHTLRAKTEKYSAVFSVCGFPELNSFSAVVETFRKIARLLHAPLVSTVLRPGAQFLAESPITRNKVLDILCAVEKGGRELIEKGRVSGKVRRTVSMGSGLSGKAWRKQMNLHWSCRRELS